MTEVLDAEIVSDETTFEPDLPLHLLGWCNDVKIANSTAEANRLHDKCPAVIPPRPWPDPTRPGRTYMLKGYRCSCECHTRPVV